MRIEAIVSSPDQPSNREVYDFYHSIMVQSEVINQISGYDVTAYNDGQLLGVCFKEKDGSLALAATFSVVNSSTFQTKRINVFPGHTGKKLAPSLTNIWSMADTPYNLIWNNLTPEKRYGQKLFRQWELKLKCLTF